VTPFSRCVTSSFGIPTNKYTLGNDFFACSNCRMCLRSASRPGKGPAPDMKQIKYAIGINPQRSVHRRRIHQSSSLRVDIDVPLISHIHRPGGFLPPRPKQVSVRSDIARRGRILALIEMLGCYLSGPPARGELVLCAIKDRGNAVCIAGILFCGRIARGLLVFSIVF